MSQDTPHASMSDTLKRYRWLYLLGWLFLAVLALIGQWLGPALFQHLNRLVDLLAPSTSITWKILLTVAALVIGPLVAGSIAQLLLRIFEGRREVGALLQMQKKLFAEIEPGGERGYRVALLDWPNPDVRTLGLVTSTFEESSTGRQLAAVFIPNTPDATSGTMKVLALEDLSIVDWTLEEVSSFHLTFGSVSPEAC